MRLNQAKEITVPELFAGTLSVVKRKAPKIFSGVPVLSISESYEDELETGFGANRGHFT